MGRPIAAFDDQKSDISGKPTIKVPVIRIFGADQAGRKICLHVHGFYPYIAIQDPDPKRPELKKKIVSDITRALDQLVDRNQRERPQQPGPSEIRHPQLPDHNDDESNDLPARIQQERRPLLHLSGEQRFPIHKIESIKSFNYYGYHDKPEDFYKLYLYNPRMVKHLATLFEDCKVLAKFIPVFWAHLPYILLFFIDNNLRGMQFIEVDRVEWRKHKAPAFDSQIGGSQSQFGDGVPVEDDEFSDSSDDDFGVLTTRADPISTCELEADIRYEWILNRQRLSSKGNDDALKDLWLDDQEASQTSSKIIESKLPLFSVELGYLQQLFDVYNIEETSLNLELTERYPGQAGLVKKAALEDRGSDSDEICDSPTNRTPSHPQRRCQTPSRTPDIKLGVSKPKKLHSDNSMIDGCSILETSAGQSRAGSQKSAGSSKEMISHEYQFFTMMSMELHATTRNKLRPDPAFDPIEAVFYCVRNDIPDTSNKPEQVIGLIITDPWPEFDEKFSSTPNLVKSPSARSNVSFVTKMRSLLSKTGLSLQDLETKVVDTELELIIALVETVKAHDPEILLGYEVEQLSWGYVLERASILNVSISLPLSRITEKYFDSSSESVDHSFVQPIIFTGRMVFAVWRIVRHEITLNTWSYEKLHHHCLNERVPCFSFETLTEWFNQNRNRWRVMDYYLIRVAGQMRILDKFDLIAKVSELARCYGTQFIDVITRGSQIGIESMMLRLAKLQNLVPLSPTVMQRNKMRAPEALPLVMEPETNIYYDPIAVLDFQSLYPSVVIAYNYCYSTCLGRVMDLEKMEQFHFGCSHLNIAPDEVKRLLETNSVHVSPCGVAFVKKNIRKGILPKMLSELILTRAMVKDQMKKNMKSERPNRRLQRILDHRQHGLKMMANTTYGYTGASYTGRMPCVEIADSIVSKGRETLERSIELVESRVEWGARVIYGDTDSMFILFKDCDKDTAFKRSMEMVEAITASNPYPIKMKFEKIYQPCVLQTKKRYCGFKFESPEQRKPEFEVKGMESIRRDCCPGAAKMLEMALRIQFTTRDTEKVRKYVQHQFMKILSGRLSNLQDFIFARKYKPRDLDSSESVFVPAWQITRRLLTQDPRAEPRLNERVPFVITYGEPKTPLVKLAKTPMELLDNLSFRINADYYIQKIICPTLNRVFCTLKVDTLLWYKSMPHGNILHRSHYLVAQKNHPRGSNLQSTMSQYFRPSHCPVCAKSIRVSDDDICDSCREDMHSSVVRLTEEISRSQRKMFAVHQLCRACSSLERRETDDHYNPCISYDCPNLFRYHQAKLDAFNSNYLAQVLKALS